MWIFTNQSYLSVVQHRDDPNLVLVRARIEGDIEEIFPEAFVFQEKGSDYKYRAAIEKSEVAVAIAKQIMEIDYDNFKGSIEDINRHNVYLYVWFTMLQWQKGQLPDFD